jgi:hypothetical protein
MMDGLTRRAELLAAAEQRRQVRRLAARIAESFGVDAVEIGDAGVVIRGRGLLKRWLIDPGLRFLASGIK